MGEYVRRDQFAPRWWYVLVTTFVAAFVFSVLAFWLAVRVSEQNLRQICAVVSASDNAYHETPPTTKAGKNVAQATADLRAQLGCD